MLYTIDQLRERHSVRSYLDQPLKGPALKAIRREVEDINAAYAAEGVRFALCMDEPQAFGSFKRSYGFFKNVRNYVVAIVDRQSPHGEEVAGYAGERFCMKALMEGLGTCFVGATYDVSKVQVNLSASEKIAFLITVGEAAPSEGFIASIVKKMAHRKSLAPEGFYASDIAFFNLQEARARLPYLQSGLEAMACAPSALNKQLVRVWQGEDSYLHAGLAHTNEYTDVDLGIAKFNFQTVVNGKWEWGDGGRFLTY